MIKSHHFQDGFFDLTLDNPEGCLSCDCDPGGSLDLVCPKVGGQCVCRPGIEGRTCKQPLQGMFVPSLDHILLEAEFSDNAAVSNVLRKPNVASLLSHCRKRWLNTEPVLG